MTVPPLQQVLIIDTDNVRRGMLACTLPATRFSLEFAKSIERGLDMIGKVKPELVILGRDNTAGDLCQRIRSLPAGENCLVLLMDERYRDETVGESEAEAVGADGYLPFPFEADLLNERLTELATPKPAPRGADLVKESTTGLHPGAAAADPTAEDEVDTDEETAWRSFRQRVFWLYDNLDKLDYYELLQLGHGASATDIKTAYFTCSMEYHPDRFLQLDDEHLKDQIYEVYKRMSEAFKVLSSPAHRSAYEEGLSGADRAKHLRFIERPQKPIPARDPTAEADTAAGKKHLGFANLAEAEGNLRSARMYLSLALQCEPQNAAIRERLEQVTQRLRK